MEENEDNKDQGPKPLKENRITVFYHPSCTRCRAVLDWLEDSGVPPKVIEVDTTMKASKAALEKLGITSVPAYHLEGPGYPEGLLRNRATSLKTLQADLGQ